MGQDIRTYRAGSIQEAIELVRRDLGPDASVLHTRQVKTGALSWMRSAQVEVTASAAIQAPSRFESEEPATPETPARNPVAKSAVYQQHMTLAEANHQPDAEEPLWDFQAYQNRVQSVVQRDLQESYSPEPSAEIDLSAIVKPDVDAQTRELPTETLQENASAELKAQDGNLGLGRPQLWDRLHLRLLEAEFENAIAQEFADRVLQRVGANASMKQATQELQRLLEDEITPAGPIASGSQHRVIALVGPTGVGKTTTIAKLAADLRLRQHCRVGLITFDTYRIAAVDQLRTYAEIIDLPMQVVGSLDEMPAALVEMRDLDVVLMDTAGRSPQDETRIRELRIALQQASVDEIHLVLSCTAGGRSLRGAVERFSEIGADSLILTKLDEAETFGGLFGMLRDSKLAISHLTDGQAVPDDIQVASSRKLAEKIVAAI